MWQEWQFGPDEESSEVNHTGRASTHKVEQQFHCHLRDDVLGIVQQDWSIISFKGDTAEES